MAAPMPATAPSGRIQSHGETPPELELELLEELGGDGDGTGPAGVGGCCPVAAAPASIACWYRAIILTTRARALSASARV